MVTGIAYVVLVFLYYTVVPWNLIGAPDPIGGEAGYQQVADRAEAELQKTGATWIATTDYRTYAMMRWYFKDRVPVIQINERGRFMGFRDPGMDRIRGHAGRLCRARARQGQSDLGRDHGAARAARTGRPRLARRVMDTYALQKVTGWTPELVAAAGCAAVSLAGAGGRCPDRNPPCDAG